MTASAKPRTQRKPRLWVPGVAYVDDERVLTFGREVGFNGWGEDFRLAGCHFMSLGELRHRVWLVERSKLSDEIVDEHALILPHTLVDGETQPHARAWLERQPLLCVSGLKLGPLIDKGLRVYCVEHGVESERLMRVQAAGDDRPAWSLRLDVEQLQQQIMAQIDGPASVVAESRAMRGAVDRILRVVTRGVLSEVAVLNAYLARRLVEPGYGYQGATDGRAASVEQIAVAVSGIEALFAQIDARAKTQRLIARDAREAVRGLPEQHGDVELPQYGVARRARLEALDIALEDNPAAAPSWTVAGEPRARLTLPVTHDWTVSDIKLWSPQLPEEVRARLLAERKPRPAPPAWLTPALLLALLTLIGVALTQLR